MTWIVKADLEDRISAETVRQIFDDDASGVADTSPLARLIADAESYVSGFLRRVYDLDAIRAMGTSCPNEVKRLCLDVAVAYAVDRWPDYIGVDGEKLMSRARRDLTDLAEGRTRLDIVGAPEPAANEGGDVVSDDPSSPTPRPKFFIGSMGDF